MVSSREHRKKASEIFRETHYPFAPKTSFENAFPQIEDVLIRVEEKGRGVDRRFYDEGKRTRTFTKANVSEYVDCSNSLCFNGGVSIGSLLREAAYERRTEFEETAICQGYEGSPKGRDKYRDCFNFFTIKGEITYKEGDPTSQRF